mgnify:CR=1 FL=1|jgi:hypothetical protein
MLTRSTKIYFGLYKYMSNDKLKELPLDCSKFVSYSKKKKKSKTICVKQLIGLKDENGYIYKYMSFTPLHI